MIAPPESQKRMKTQPTPKPSVPCDVKDCKSAWIIVVYIRESAGPPNVKREVKHSVKLCASCYKEFKAGKSPTLKG